MQKLVAPKTHLGIRGGDLQTGTRSKAMIRDERSVVVNHHTHAPCVVDQEMDDLHPISKQCLFDAMNSVVPGAGENCRQGKGWSVIPDQTR